MVDAGAVKVWDLPTRLWHWTIVLLLAFSWYSAENDAMDWHYRSGLTLLGLLIFRVIWGFIGSSTARFANFLRGPSAAWAYLRRPAGSQPLPGHNPLGGYSVILLLLVLAGQIAAGLFAVDIDGLESGPLSHLVSFDQGRVAAEIHEIIFNILLGLIGLHILAILYYRLRGRKLIMPLLTGKDPQIAADTPAYAPASFSRVALALLVAGAMAWFVSRGLTL